MLVIVALEEPGGCIVWVSCLCLAGVSKTCHSSHQMLHRAEDTKRALPCVSLCKADALPSQYVISNMSNASQQHRR